MTKGVTLSESSDSGILNAEPSILTVISNLSRFILSAYSQGTSPGFDPKIEVLVATYRIYVHLPRFKQAQVIDSLRPTIDYPISLIMHSNYNNT
jgi:hypothetical protein